jgi:hypothetical protein
MTQLDLLDEEEVSNGIGRHYIYRLSPAAQRKIEEFEKTSNGQNALETAGVDSSRRRDRIVARHSEQGSAPNPGRVQQGEDGADRLLGGVRRAAVPFRRGRIVPCQSSGGPEVTIRTMNFWEAQADRAGSRRSGEMVRRNQFAGAMPVDFRSPVSICASRSTKKLSVLSGRQAGISGVEVRRTVGRRDGYTFPCLPGRYNLLGR